MAFRPLCETAKLELGVTYIFEFAVRLVVPFVVRSQVREVL
jgi:hypothetical protein